MLVGAFFLFPLIHDDIRFFALFGHALEYLYFIENESIKILSVKENMNTQKWDFVP